MRIASNPAFKRAILQYAKGKNPKTVLNQAIRGGQSWLSKISHGSLMFRELSKPAREAIAQSQYELEKKLVAKLSIKNRKSGKLAKNRRKAKQERSRMVSNASKVTEFSAEQAAQMMAIFLKLNIIEADKDAEIMRELSKKASQLRCLSMAKTKMSRCLIDSKNADDVVFCQIVFSQEQLACYSNQSSLFPSYLLMKPPKDCKKMEVIT